MRRALGALMIWSWVTTAWAGPKVPKNMLGSVPETVTAEVSTLREELATLNRRIVAANHRLDKTKDRIRGLKVEVKAADAGTKAEKANLKVVRKSKDKAEIKAAKARVKAKEEVADGLRRQVVAKQLFSDLLGARIEVLEAEKSEKEALIQLRLAAGVSGQYPDLDVNRFDIAHSKTEIGIQNARTKVSQVQAKAAGKGIAMPEEGEAPKDPREEANKANAEASGN